MAPHIDRNNFVTHNATPSPHSNTNTSTNTNTSNETIRSGNKNCLLHSGDRSAVARLKIESYYANLVQQAKERESR